MASFGVERLLGADRVTVIVCQAIRDQCGDSLPIGFVFSALPTAYGDKAYEWQ